MTAQIIYFPNHGVTFRPSADDRSISIAQFEDLKYLIQDAARWFESDSTRQLATKNIVNKLRVTFCLRRLEDLPTHHFLEAKRLIEQAEEELRAYHWHEKAMRELFAEKVLRNGDPWTPQLQAKLRKKLAMELPDRPDWRELAKELETTTRRY